MKYADLHPSLSKKLKLDPFDFELIIAIIDLYFADFFPLEVFESEANKKIPCAYFDFFQSCLNALNDLHSAEEILPAINEFLQEPERRVDLLQHFNFLPQVEGKNSKQLGFLEKLAVGDLKKDEPLTYLDMLRCVHGLKVLSASLREEKLRCNVYALKQLKAYPEDKIAALKKQHHVLILNLSLNSPGLAKWAILDLVQNRLYCESDLSGEEKKILDKALRLTVVTYLGGTADSLVTTGYRALAWLDENITKAWNFNEYADLASLKQDFMLIQFAGDDPGLEYFFSPGERESYTSLEFKSLLSRLNEYELALISDLKPSAGLKKDVLYIQSSRWDGLTYLVIAPDGKGRENTISWSKLPGFPRDEAEILNLVPGDKHYEALFAVTARKGHTRLNSKKSKELESYYLASILTQLTTIAILGKINTDSFEQHDLRSVLRLIVEKKISRETIAEHVAKAAFTALPGFAVTLGECKNPPLLQETLEQSGGDLSSKVRLMVPRLNDVLMDRIKKAHYAHCQSTRTNREWIDFLPARAPRKGSSEEFEFYAVMMVLTLLRSRAQKSIIEIELPWCHQLNSDEIQFAINTLSHNPFVTQFEVGGNNSLKKVKEALNPIFARNRWLAHKGYKPPLFADFWQQAAKYWALHLNEAITLLSPKKEHQLFKGCVKDMGLEGLKSLLNLLKDGEQRHFFETSYGVNKPAFFIACSPQEASLYFSTLIEHLRAEAYFPFSELGLAYDSRNHEELMELFSLLNGLGSFAKITLTDCLEPWPLREFFLNDLIQEAKSARWLTLFSIPELEDGLQKSLRQQSLSSQYNLLNDIILRNKHEIEARALNQKLMEVSHFESQAKNPQLSLKLESRIEEVPEELNIGIEYLLQSLKAKNPQEWEESWPLRRGGVTQLQLQQQQQIEKNCQIQQEHQQVRLKTIEAPIAQPLVDYTNIAEHLSLYFQVFCAENSLDENKACLRSQGETLLQGFFHTWINANPLVPAPHVIAKMTLPALKVLIRYHAVLSSGLNPDNLPKGFYTQRDKDDALVLCYDPSLGFVNLPTSLTLKFAGKPILAKPWKGDFRQVDLERYEQGFKASLEPRDWENLAFFAQMQPKRDTQHGLKAFYAILNSSSYDSSATLRQTIEKNAAKILKYWDVFIQLWQYLGYDGVSLFMEQDESYFSLELNKAAEILFFQQASHLQDWLIHLELTLPELQAFGQIYSFYGKETLGLFLTKLKQIKDALGEEFFQGYRHSLLNTCPDYRVFITPDFFVSMDEMMDELKRAKDLGTRKAWQSILSCHRRCVTFDKIENLWRGFKYFKGELEGMGLELQGEEFSQLGPQNMLMSMDRILASLKQIPDLAEQQRFLRHLPEVDLSHGGVFYALVYEGFKKCDKELELHDFYQKSQIKATYSPNLQDLYVWGEIDAGLNLKRILASQKQFSHEEYHFLAKVLEDGSLDSRHALIWLMHSHYATTETIADLFSQIQSLNPDFKTIIATHIHQAKYQYQVDLNLQLEALLALCKDSLLDESLLKAYPKGTLLEALSLLYQVKNWSEAPVLIELFTKNKALKVSGSADYFYHQGYKLTALFSAIDSGLFQAFIRETGTLKPLVREELKLLIQQLLSLDHEKSDLSVLKEPFFWQSLLICLEKMQKEPTKAESHRITLIESFVAKGLDFKYTKGGDFRALTIKDKPAELTFFLDHQERLWSFMKAHLIVSADKVKIEESLRPLMLFFKRLQLNSPHLNEIEPLLATLEEEVQKDSYWTIAYFNGLLRALQPQNDAFSFPITLLKVLLREPALIFKSKENLAKDFPLTLNNSLQAIVKNTHFKRAEQAKLCQMALQEYVEKVETSLLHEILALLSSEAHTENRNVALEFLSQAANFLALELRFETCSWFLQHQAQAFHPLWKKTSTLWLQALNQKPEIVGTLFEWIRASLAKAADKQALILQIMAYSSLKPGLRKMEVFEYELREKSLKLTQSLALLSLEDLQKIANLYPGDPEPNTDDLSRMLKFYQEGHGLQKAVEAFFANFQARLHGDYIRLVVTREADLQRMIRDTRLRAGRIERPLSLIEASRITLIFAHLKRLEEGESLDGFNKPIASMNRLELTHAFKERSKLKPSDELMAEIWALLFMALDRTTGQYPHLAQQFSLIAKEVSLTPNKPHVLKLATGEGKGNFGALRAARYAGLGKIVAVCSIKRSLTLRDLEMYQRLFHYLDFITAYIQPKSSFSTYERAQIYYTTLGDLSLFFDEQSHLGQLKRQKKEDMVALFDEFDAIYFTEGGQTEYNYAQPLRESPKQRAWFYKAVHAFYLAHQDKFNQEGRFKTEDLRDFILYLQAAAGGNEEKLSLLSNIFLDKLHLVQWLQSAHEANLLEWGGQNGFTVRPVTVEIGEETYPLRAIIPLANNQPMFDSTFSRGVQQLVAVRLNAEAKSLSESAPAEKRAQNFYVHPESMVISSQVATECIERTWGLWEGFSGTISATQALILDEEYAAEVLHVPTNQVDLRLWHKLELYDSIEARNKAILEQTHLCLAKKQSILFACKNDAQVKELQAYFKLCFTVEEQTQFIFYTNEEEKTPKEILIEKTAAEAWQGGKKQKGVGLIASGFSRGDNVGVDAVIVLDVTDVNDLWQKAGRTARNGEVGEVFQSYLADDLRKEEALLIQAIKKALGNPAEFAALEEFIVSLSIAKEPNQAWFERILLLREYRFNLENQIHQAYRKAKAKYSSWGMEQLAQIVDISLRQELAIFLGHKLKFLDKAWLKIFSEKTKSQDEKLFALKEELDKIADDFAQTYQKITQTTVEPFYLRELKLQGIHFQTDPVKLRGQEEQRLIALITQKLMDISKEKLNPAMVKDIPLLLGKLEQGELKHLVRFTRELDSCTNLSLFHYHLSIVVNDMEGLTELGQAFFDLMQEKNSLKSLWACLDEGLRQEFSSAIHPLTPGLKTLTLEKLLEGDMRDAKTKVEEALSLIHYLRGFSSPELEALAKEYLIYLHVLEKEIPQDLRNRLLPKWEPMSYRHFYTLWRLTKTYAKDDSLESLERLMRELAACIKASPEQRLRCFTKWSAWANTLTKEIAWEFLLTFSKSLNSFEEGVNWDLFVILVDKTHGWWKKGAAFGQSYQEPLLELWRLLSQQDKATLSLLSPFIQDCLKSAGKDWFERLSLGLKALAPLSESPLPADFLSQLSFSLEGLWLHLGQNKMNHAAKLQALEEAYASLSLFYQIIQKREVEKLEVSQLRHEALKIDSLSGQGLIRLLLDLSQDTFAYFIDFMQKHEAKIRLNPNLMIYLLAACKNRALTRMKLLSDALIQLDDLAISTEKTIHAQGLQKEDSEPSDNQQEKEPAEVVEQASVKFKSASLLLSLEAYEDKEDATLEHLLKAFSLGYQNPSSLVYLLNYIPQHDFKPIKTMEKILKALEMLCQKHPQFKFDSLLLSLDAYQEDSALKRLQEAFTFGYQNPHSLVYLLNYISEHSALQIKSVETILAIMDIFCHRRPELNYEELLPWFVVRFQNENEDTVKNEDTLKLLNELLRPERSLQPLFDDAVFYLRDLISPEQQKKCIAVIQNFYRSLAIAEGDLSSILSSWYFSDCFNFSGYAMAKYHKQRLILMHLLYQGVFIAENLPHVQGYDWPESKNAELEEACFRRYQKRIDEILRQDTLGNPPGKVQDLSSDQQKNLLELIEEFKIIGITLQSPNKVEKEAVSLEPIIHNSSYELILDALLEAKKAIIHAELTMKQRRHADLNLGYQNSLYATLNHMQAGLLQAYSKNLEEAQGRCLYQNQNKKEFIELAKLLQTSLDTYIQDDADEGRKMQLAPSHRFFNVVDRTSNLKELQATLTELLALESWAQEEEAELLPKFKAVMQALELGKKNLPEDWQTLTTELLAKGESLIETETLGKQAQAATVGGRLGCMIQ